MARALIQTEVEVALSGARPVVALESAVVTSGMPRAPVGGLCPDLPGWRDNRPVNLEVALLMQRLVREGGAVPAMVGVIDGTLRIGLDDHEVERLARDERAGKASIANLAACCASGLTAGTTVSATLHACEVASIRVFATGGIGGVHRARPTAPRDISADLVQLARSPVLTVCAGAKSILDVPATLEALETLGVPVIGYRTSRFPQFYTEGTVDLPVAHRAESAQEVASICRAHWNDLGFRGGILLANPVPAEYALCAAELEGLIDQAEQTAAERSVTGAHRTPFLLAELARLSEGRTLRANIALLASNAKLAARVAVALRERESEDETADTRG